jgi:predicted aspartyl protease
VSFAFNSQQGLILVRTEIWGPSGSGILLLALDTGATSTLINQSRLLQLGYDPAVISGRSQVSTASGVEFVPRLPLSQIVALRIERHDFQVLSHTLPPSAGVDGLLGLDFLRGLSLIVDFRKGLMELS